MSAIDLARTREGRLVTNSIAPGGSDSGKGMSLSRSASRALRWPLAALVSVSLLSVSAQSKAIGQAGRAERVATARTITRAPSAPAPRVALQLSALRVSEGVPLRAMLHAIARDAWPQLVTCASGAGARGVARVFFSAEGRRVRVTELSGAPVARNATLRQCVQAAVERIHPPATDAPEIRASFELYFDMPAL